MAFNIFKKEESGAKEVAVPKSEEKKEKTARTPKGKRPGFAWRILKAAHVTEKATDLSNKDKYIFNVYKNANKNEIRKEVENIYGVNVVSVNIINVHGKKRRLGKTMGIKPGYKKAIVGIQKGQKIELMPR
ncbi:MAG: 50S ribosomal protein L23 [Patescibacteria group bacterium]